MSEKPPISVDLMKNLLSGGSVVALTPDLIEDLMELLTELQNWRDFGVALDKVLNTVRANDNRR